MIKKNILVCILVFGLVACSSDKVSEDTVVSTEENANQVENPNIFIDGVLKNGNNSTLILEANTDKGLITINKTVTDENGKFHLDGEIKDLGLYQIRLEDDSANNNRTQKIVPLTLVPGDKLTVELDANDFNLSVVYGGTSWSEPLNGFMEKLKESIELQKSINTQNFQQESPEEQTKIMKQIVENRKPLNRYIIEEVKKDPSNPAHLLLMMNLMPVLGFDYYDPKNIDALKSILQAYKEKYPDNPMTARIETQVTELKQGYEDYQSFQVKKEIPEIALPNPEGKEIKLSSLRGNYVLIDFWAAWCPPCRAENPNLVRLYNKYKDKNFKIFSVSLDDNKEDWIKAIKHDKLEWDYHVSDLLKWKTPLVQKFQFNSIPHTIFIDPDGRIIAENLRGITLEKKLQELFGK